MTFEVVVRSLEGRVVACNSHNVRYYNVLHQLCYLLGARYRNVTIHEFACNQLGVLDCAVTSGRVFFEMRSVEERHHLLQLAFWYMADINTRLTMAWNAGAVTYSALLRDFESDRPGWYDRIVNGFADWHKRESFRAIKTSRAANGRFR